jgi:hypothetical protein
LHLIFHQNNLMKKTLLTLAIAAVAKLGAFAQATPIPAFTQTTGTYVNLTSPTVLSVTGWDEDDYALTLPFPFHYGNNTYTDVTINDNGYLDFDAGTTAGAWIDVHYADLAERATGGASEIGYTVSGTTGSRILKIEWKNAGFYEGTAAEFVNVQLWLYEGSNKVEIHNGPNNIVSFSDIYSTAGGPDVGLTIYATPASFDGIYLQGSGATPTALVVTGGTSTISLSSPPTAGSVFNFLPSTATGVAKALNNAAVTVYPNPVADVVTISGLPAGKNTAVWVYDALGKVVLNQEIAAGNAVKVNVSNLPKGTYFMEATAGESRVGKQLIKL